MSVIVKGGGGGKSSGQYVWKKYEAVKVMISFTIAGTSYQAEEGMTWGEWCESSYNNGGYYIDNNSITFPDNMGEVVYDRSASAYPQPNTTIVNNHVYIHRLY